ncbi:MAG: LysR family transcriptional regulator, partial [Veillonellaceae bacterium]|nr:LysR family transcriptional regulator [Veillonellaceae bacterium]
MQKYIALLKVIQVGSFTKAADLLGYTQPALSQMIASLEKELSIKILYRSRYGIQLTPEGERLYPAIQESVLQYEAMQRQADEIRGLDSGIV